MSVDPSARVHPTAIVSPDSIVGARVEIGPYCVVGARVEIGPDTVVGPSVLLEGPVQIGARNHFYGHAAVGTNPQDLKFKGEETWLIIGDDNHFREFVTLNRGTATGNGVTRIGSRNLLMTGVHVAHDCVVGDRVIMANAATLAGHVTVADDSTVGAFTGVHQFCRVGVHAFIGGYSVITQDALPFMKTVGIRSEAKSYGINTIGLERKGFTPERLQALKAAHRTLFRKKLLLAEAVAQVRAAGEVTSDVEELLSFIESSDRGFIH